MSELKKKGFATGEWWLLFCCAVLAVLKLLLVSREEIIARFLPHDDLNYILAAQRWCWFGHSYNYMMYIRQPIYPLWIALVHLSGIPLRIAIELVFLLGAYCLVRALLSAGVLWCACAACFAVTAFHPVSFQLFNWALSDTLYAAVLLFAMAAMIALWVERNTLRSRRYAFLTGAALALLWNIRPENVLISALLVFFACVFFVVLWGAGESKRRALLRTAAMVLIPVLFIVAISGTIATANFLKIGLFVTTEMEAPGFTALCKALLRIKPSKSFRMVPITTEARQLAYSVSPTFAQLKPELENRSAWVYPISARLGVPGQVIAGLTYWFFRSAAAESGQFQSARQADAFFAQAAREINKGLADGRLPSRFVAANFLDPAVSDYLSYVPASFKSAIHLMVSTVEPQRDSDTPDTKTQQLYDEMANRRSALTNSTLVLSGWAATISGRLNQILLRGSNGETLASTNHFLPRPDVAQALVHTGLKVPAETGFTLSTTRRAVLNATSLILVSNHGEYAIPLRNLNLPLAGVVYHVDSVSVDEVPLQRRIETRVWRLHGRLVRLFTWMALGGAVFLTIGVLRKRRLPEGVWAVLGLLLFVVVTRFSLFVLLDASSWPSLQERYFFPVMPLYSCCLLIVIAEALRLAFRWIRPARPVPQLPVLLKANSAD